MSKHGRSGSRSRIPSEQSDGAAKDADLTRRELLKTGVVTLGGMVLAGCAGAASQQRPLVLDRVGTAAGAGAELASSSVPARAEVFFTKDLSAKGLVEIYSRISGSITGKVAIKVHTGEPKGPNILPREMVKALQQQIPRSNLVETNTLYKGGRFTTADHRETIKINGWDFCPVDIMDEDGAVMVPVQGGRRFKEMSVGKHLLDYDSLVVLTHFKGHAMGGYGGSLKNIAIGCVDGAIGKKMVHDAPDNVNYAAWLTGKPFQENMVEAAKAVVDHFAPRIVYVNVLRNMSVDCDCAGIAAAPVKARDLGILASNDLLAVDQASIDMVYGLPEAELHDLKERIETREGLHQLEYMKALKMGREQYQLIEIGGELDRARAPMPRDAVG